MSGNRSLIKFFNLKTKKTFYLDLSKCVTRSDINKLIEREQGIKSERQTLAANNHLLPDNIETFNFSGYSEITLDVTSEKISVDIVLGTEKFTYATFNTQTIRNIKSYVANHTESDTYMPLKMDIFYDNTLLNDDRTLEDLNIPNGAKLYFSLNAYANQRTLIDDNKVRVILKSDNKEVCRESFMPITNIATIIDNCCIKIGLERSYVSLEYKNKILDENMLLQEVDTFDFTNANVEIVFILVIKITIIRGTSPNCIRIKYADTVSDVINMIKTQYNIKGTVDLLNGNRTTQPNSVITKLLKQENIKFTLREKENNNHVMISVQYANNDRNCNVEMDPKSTVNDLIQLVVRKLDLNPRGAYRIVYIGRCLDNTASISSEHFSDATRVTLIKQSQSSDEEEEEEEENITPSTQVNVAIEFEKAYNEILTNPRTISIQMEKIQQLLKEDINHTIPRENLTKLFNICMDKLNTVMSSNELTAVTNVVITILDNTPDLYGSFLNRFSLVKYTNHMMAQEIQKLSTTIDTMISLIMLYFKPTGDSERRYLQNNSRDYSVVTGQLLELIRIHRANSKLIKRLLNTCELLLSFDHSIKYNVTFMDTMMEICNSHPELYKSFAFMANKLIITFANNNNSMSVRICLDKFKDEPSCINDFLDALNIAIRNKSTKAAILPNAVSYLISIMKMEECEQQELAIKVLRAFKIFVDSPDCAEYIKKEEGVQALFHITNQNSDSNDILTVMMSILEHLAYYENLCSDICKYGKSCLNQLFNSTFSDRVIKLFNTLSFRADAIAIVNNDLMTNIYTYTSGSINRDIEKSIIELFQNLMAKVSNLDLNLLTSSSQLEFVSLALHYQASDLNSDDFKALYDFIKKVALEKPDKIQILVDSGVIKTWLDFKDFSSDLPQHLEYIDTLALLTKYSVNGFGNILYKHASVLSSLNSSLGNNRPIDLKEHVLKVFVELAKNERFRGHFFSDTLYINFKTVSLQSLKNGQLSAPLIGLFVNLADSEDVSIVLQTLLIIKSYVLNTVFVEGFINSKCEELASNSELKDKLILCEHNQPFRAMLKNEIKNIRDKNNITGMKKYLRVTKTSCCEIV